MKNNATWVGICKYIASFTCYAKPIFPYIVRKFFEIPSTGCLLVANDDFVKKHMKELGFEDNVNYISVTDKNVENKIKYILDPKNKQKIDEIRRNGQKLIVDRHLDVHRVEYITEICNKLIS